MTLLYLDIETLCTTDPAVIEALSATVTAPGQYKKQESIDAWLKDNKDQAVKELVAKTSFDGLFGKIACIAWAFDDGEVYSTLASDTESQVINSLYAAVAGHLDVAYRGGTTSSALTVCGHNVAGFDLPFLKHRSIILGIKPPPPIRRAMNARPWDECLADTMLMWSSDRDKRVGLDKLCKAFDIAGKGDFDGSMVAEEWENGSKEKVIDYCKDDIERTRAIYKRMMFL